MQKEALFYILPDSYLGEFGSLFSHHEQVALNLLFTQLKNKKKIYLHCDSQKQAEQFDEYLWQYPADRFVPHTLKGEGEKSFAPLQIGWGELPRSVRADVIINLEQEKPTHLQDKNCIIDFVPIDESLKILARQRYLFYKQQGFSLKTVHFEG